MTMSDIQIRLSVVNNQISTLQARSDQISQQLDALRNSGDRGQINRLLNEADSLSVTIQRLRNDANDLVRQGKIEQGIPTATLQERAQAQNIPFINNAANQDRAITLAQQQSTAQTAERANLEAQARALQLDPTEIKRSDNGTLRGAIRTELQQRIYAQQRNVQQQVNQGTLSTVDIIPKGTELPLTPENVSAVRQAINASEANKKARIDSSFALFFPSNTLNNSSSSQSGGDFSVPSGNLNRVFTNSGVSVINTSSNSLTNQEESRNISNVQSTSQSQKSISESIIYGIAQKYPFTSYLPSLINPIAKDLQQTEGFLGKDIYAFSLQLGGGLLNVGEQYLHLAIENPNTLSNDPFSSQIGGLPDYRKDTLKEYNLNQSIELQNNKQTQNAQIFLASIPIGIAGEIFAPLSTRLITAGLSGYNVFSTATSSYQPGKITQTALDILNIKEGAVSLAKYTEGYINTKLNVKQIVPTQTMKNAAEPFSRQRATVILKNQEGRFILGMNENEHIISFGGARNPGESLRSAALRELLEETGVKRNDLISFKKSIKIVTPEETQHVFIAELKPTQFSYQNGDLIQNRLVIKPSSDIKKIVTFQEKDIPVSSGASAKNPITISTKYGDLRVTEVAILNKLIRNIEPTYLIGRFKEGDFYIAQQSRYDVSYKETKIYDLQSSLLVGHVTPNVRINENFTVDPKLFFQPPSYIKLSKEYSVNSYQRLLTKKNVDVLPENTLGFSQDIAILGQDVKGFTAKRSIKELGYLALSYGGLQNENRYDFNGFSFNSQSGSYIGNVNPNDLRLTNKALLGFESERIALPGTRIRAKGSPEYVLFNNRPFAVQSIEIGSDLSSISGRGRNLISLSEYRNNGRYIDLKESFGTFIQNNFFSSLLKSSSPQYSSKYLGTYSPSQDYYKSPSIANANPSYQYSSSKSNENQERLISSPSPFKYGERTSYPSSKLSSGRSTTSSLEKSPELPIIPKARSSYYSNPGKKKKRLYDSFFGLGFPDYESLQPSFNLFVRQRGKFREAGQNLTKAQAFARGEQIASNKAIRTFAVQPTGNLIRGRQSDITLSERFRPPAPKSVLNKVFGAVFVQKTKYAISSIGEKQEIPGTARRKRSRGIFG